MRKKIIAIDDYPPILDAITCILTEIGHEVETLLHGKNIITMLEQSSLPDLLLLDVWMPEINGLHLYHHFRQQEHTKNLPIILMSADSQMEGLTAINPKDILIKPFTVTELLDTINEYLH